jgi:tetratricopeptide (TPR) repeat protein
MYIVPGRCPICQSPSKDGLQCPVCGCVAKIDFGSVIPSRETINVSIVQRAVDASRRRLAQQSDDGLAHYILGFTYLHLGLFSESLGELGKAAVLLPERYEVYYEIAVIAATQDLMSPAEISRYLNIALQKGLTNKSAWFLRGVINEKQGNMPEAVRNWQSAFKLDSEYQPSSDKLMAFIAEQRSGLSSIVLKMDGLSAAATAYLNTLRIPTPEEPPLLGRTSLELLRQISPRIVRRMKQTYANEVASYQAYISERQMAIQNIESDLLAFSSLCLLSYEAKQQEYQTTLAQQKADAEANAPLAADDRRSILDGSVQNYLRKGFRFLSQTDTTTQLYRPARFPWSCSTKLLVVITGSLYYFICYVTRKDVTIFLEVNSRGQVLVTQS